MQTPAPFARGQQIIGMPEHPCETIFRNGTLICPYEEMEIRFFPEHAGLYLVPLIGEPFTLFGQGQSKAAQRWQGGYLPIAAHTTVQDGFGLEETVYACLLEQDSVVDGTEPLINMVQFTVENLDTYKPAEFILTLVFGNCFRPPIDTDGAWDRFYWKDFLLRDDMYETLDAGRQIAPYPYTLRRKGNCLIAGDRGIVFALDQDCDADFEYFDNYGTGSWADGQHFRKGIRFTLHLEPGQKQSLCYKIPYLPLPKNKKDSLDLLYFEDKRRQIIRLWDAWLNRGALLSVPGTGLDNLWKAQTAATFILVDRQNKGSADLYGGELYRQWSDHYPDRTLCYPHLSPTLYEFIWAQECAYWVMGMLDAQGYHKEVEEYFEVFFALQGCGTPGVHDPSVLPDKSVGRSFMGTTAHAWLNSNGSVLAAIARHYRLTKDKEWIIKHKDSIISACRWISELRRTTKNDLAGNGYGLMPPGQSTDATFSSDHLQWYYTDGWTLFGLVAIAPVMEECGIEGAEEIRLEAEDYTACFLRSVDSSILTADQLPINPWEYDFSPYRYSGALEDSLITEYDERGIPLVFKDRIITRDKAKEMGISMFIPMSPQCTVPMTIPYLDNAFNHLFGLLAPIIDFQSDKPLFDGARFSGKTLWDGIVSLQEALGLYNIKQGIYPYAISYIEYLMEKFLACDDTEDYARAITFTRRYACDPENHMMVEEAGLNRCEKWFQPCPFALSMSNFRSWLFKAFLYEDPRTDRLVVGKALPKEWMENAVTYEKPLMLQRAATGYGTVSVAYNVSLIQNIIEVQLHFDDPSRMPQQLEIRLNHPLGAPLVSARCNGSPCHDTDTARGVVTLSRDSLGDANDITVVANFPVDLR